MNRIHNGMKTFRARSKFNFFFHSLFCLLQHSIYFRSSNSSNFEPSTGKGLLYICSKCHFREKFLTFVELEIFSFFFIFFFEVNANRKLYKTYEQKCFECMNMSKKQITGKIVYCVQCWMLRYTLLQTTNTKLNFIRFTPRYYSKIRNCQKL